MTSHSIIALAAFPRGRPEVNVSHKGTKDTKGGIEGVVPGPVGGLVLRSSVGRKASVSFFVLFVSSWLMLLTREDSLYDSPVMVATAKWNVRFFLFTCSNGAGEAGSERP